MNTSTEKDRQKQAFYWLHALCFFLFGKLCFFRLECAEWIKLPLSLPSIFCTQVTAAHSDSCLRATLWWLHWSQAAKVPFDSFPNTVGTAAGSCHRTLRSDERLRELFVFQARDREKEKKTSTSLACAAQSILEQTDLPRSLFAERRSDHGHFRVESSYNHCFD